MMTNKPLRLQAFLQSESAGGVLLMLAAVLAIIFANTPLNLYYKELLAIPVEVQVGSLEIAKPMLLWINDGLMALFFFLVGLELKRDLVEGELSHKSNIILPAAGAVGGMVVPALFYWYFNADDPVALKGWAIPAATDIAFALGVLMLLGNRVPNSLKVFLVSLAIFDDIGAILIIAFFYTANISFTALYFVALCIALLVYMNKRNVVDKRWYLFIGLAMWVAMLKSGVHATLAGVILALLIPMRSRTQPDISPVKSLEHDLHGMVSLVVLPVFAFANSGLSLAGVTWDQVTHGVPIGIITGLFLGKQLGIFGICWLSIRCGITKIPKGANWLSLYGVSVLCGIGFTMSLFIGSLAFEETGVNLLFDERLGIIIGSLASGILGYVLLKVSLPKTSHGES
jgi:NhaA family Na+:H+ antiporter